MDKICRLCFVVIDTGECKLVQQSEIWAKFNSCLRLELSPVDHFPKRICKECHKKIEDIHKFRERVIQNEQKLLQHLDSNSLKSFLLQLTNVPDKDEARIAKSDETFKVEEEESLDSNHFDDTTDSSSHVILEVPFPPKIQLKTDHEHDLDNEDKAVKNITKPKTKSPNVKKQKNLENDPINLDPSNKNERHNKSDSLKQEIDVVLTNKYTLYVLDRQKPFYKCNTCGYTNEYVNEMTKHVVQHKYERPFICKLCSETFKTMEEVVNHGQLHSGFKLYCRHGCGYGSLNPESMKEHEKKHADEEKGLAENADISKNGQQSEIKPYSCSYCHKRFKRKSNVNAHLKIHTGEGWHLCSFCGKLFAQRSTLHKHQQIRHPREYYRSRERVKRPGMTEIIEYMCTECSFTCDSQEELTLHLQDHSENPPEPPGKKSFKCSYCIKHFNKRSNLIAHENTHTGEGRRLCPDCGKTYSQKSTLRRHQKSYCNKLKRYNRKETALKNDARYVCVECGKKFKLKSNLRKHQKIHNLEKYDGMVVEALDHQYVSTYETVKCDAE